MNPDKTMLMFTNQGHFYPIEGSGKVPLAEEAPKHGEINHHIIRIEDMKGNVLWTRTNH